MLKGIAIENYRSCLKTSIDLHPNLSVLIGPNGSGKTNILQGILFLNKIAQESEGRLLTGAVSVSSRIKAEFYDGHTKAQLSALVGAYTDRSNNDVVLSSREKWRFTRQDGKHASLDVPLAFALEFGSRWAPPDLRTRSYVLWHMRRQVMRIPTEIPKWIWRVLRGVGEYCRGIRYYGASQFTNPGSCPVSFEVEHEGRRRLFRQSGHARILYDMYSAKKAESNDRFRQFLEIVGPKGLRLIDDLTFHEVKTSSSEYSVRVGGKVEVRRRHKLLVVPQFRIGNQKLSPNQLSEGTFKTLALLFHVITEDSSALLIEEPEVCVHHGLLSSILELVKVHSQHKQMILSTHSDYVLDHVKPENLYKVSFEKFKGTVVRHIPDTMTAKELSALREYLELEGNLGEYWREGGLGDRT